MRVNPRLLHLNSQKQTSLTRKPFHSLKQRKVFHSLAIQSGRTLFKTKIWLDFAEHFRLSHSQKELIDKTLDSAELKVDEMKGVLALIQGFKKSEEILGFLQKYKTDRFSPIYLLKLMEETLVTVLCIPENSLTLKSLIESHGDSINKPYNVIQMFTPFERVEKLYEVFNRLLTRNTFFTGPFDPLLADKSVSENIQFPSSKIDVRFSDFVPPYTNALFNSLSQVCFEDYCSILTDKLINLGYLQEPEKQFRLENNLNPSGRPATIKNIIKTLKANKILPENLSQSLITKVDKILDLLLHNHSMYSFDFDNDTVFLGIPNQLIQLLSRLSYLSHNGVNPNNLIEIRKSLLKFKNYQRDDLSTLTMNLMLRDAGLAFCNFLISSHDSSRAEELQVETADCLDRISQYGSVDILYPRAQVSTEGFIKLLLANWGASPTVKKPESISQEDLDRRAKAQQEGWGTPTDNTLPESNISDAVPKAQIQEAVQEEIKAITIERITEEEIQASYENKWLYAVRYDSTNLLKFFDDNEKELPLASTSLNDSFTRWRQSDKWIQSPTYLELKTTDLDESSKEKIAFLRFIDRPNLYEFIALGFNEKVKDEAKKPYHNISADLADYRLRQELEIGKIRLQPPRPSLDKQEARHTSPTISPEITNRLIKRRIVSMSNFGPINRDFIDEAFKDIATILTTRGISEENIYTDYDEVWIFMIKNNLDILINEANKTEKEKSNLNQKQQSYFRQWKNTEWRNSPICQSLQKSIMGWILQNKIAYLYWSKPNFNIYELGRLGFHNEAKELTLKARETAYFKKQQKDLIRAKVNLETIAKKYGVKVLIRINPQEGNYLKVVLEKTPEEVEVKVLTLTSDKIKMDLVVPDRASLIKDKDLEALLFDEPENSNKILSWFYTPIKEAYEYLTNGALPY